MSRTIDQGNGWRNDQGKVCRYGVFLPDLEGNVRGVAFYFQK